MMRRWTPTIHKLAHVQKGCVIGVGTRIWQFASVIRDAVIGTDCSIASCAIVDGSRIGNRCKLQHGVFTDPGMLIGNDVFIGPHVSMCNDYWPRTDTVGWFDFVQLQQLTRGELVVTRIESGASIGANAVLMPGIVIGTGAMVAAGAVVTKDVPDNHLWRRDGTAIPIDPGRMPKRMRTAA